MNYRLLPAGHAGEARRGVGEQLLGRAELRDAAGLFGGATRSRGRASSNQRGHPSPERGDAKRGIREESSPFILSDFEVT